MYFILILLLVVILYFSKQIDEYRLKYVPIFFVSLFFMFNRGNNDYKGYINIFRYPEEYAEPGYSFLIKIIKFFGGTSHNDLLIVLGLFVAFTLYRFAKRTENFNLVLLLYAIFPLVLDITQVRNTFMILFILNALIDFHKGNKIRSFVLLIISSTFHSIGIFYIISFILLSLKKRIKFYKTIILISVFGMVFMPLIIKFGITHIPIERIASRLVIYSSETIKFDSLIIWGGILTLDLLVFYFLINEFDYTKKNKNSQLIQLMFDLMYSGLVFLGCLLFLFEFNRFIRNLFLVKSMLAAFLLPSMTKNAKIFIILYLVATTSVFAYLYTLGPSGLDFNYVILRNAMFGY